MAAATATVNDRRNFVELHVEAANEVIIVSSRGAAREIARELGFGVVDQTRIATAVSEIVRNVIQYAGSGTITMEVREEADRVGLIIRADDHGPGIEDLERVLQGGYTSGQGFGCGVSGSRALMDEFDIESEPGHGTHVRMAKWLN